MTRFLRFPSFQNAPRYIKPHKTSAHSRVSCSKTAQFIMTVRKQPPPPPETCVQVLFLCRVAVTCTQARSTSTTSKKKIFRIPKGYAEHEIKYEKNIGKPTNGRTNERTNNRGTPCSSEEPDTCKEQIQLSHVQVVGVSVHGLTPAAWIYLRPLILSAFQPLLLLLLFLLLLLLRFPGLRLDKGCLSFGWSLTGAMIP